MADSFYKLEDEAFPSFLCRSLDSTGGRATLGNVTLGSGPGLPVAASTVAKIKPASENRWGGSLVLLLLDRCDLLNFQNSLNPQAGDLLSRPGSLLSVAFQLNLSTRNICNTC